MSTVDWTPAPSVIKAGEESNPRFVCAKALRDKKLGFIAQTIQLPETVSQEELIAEVNRLNKDEGTDGILVQLPLPKHIDSAAILAQIAPDKDVDGFHAINAGLLSQGRGHLVPCTPAGVMKMLHFYDVAAEGKHAVVIGRSNIVGRPMAQLLEQQLL